jgi:hypothetical protein
MTLQADIAERLRFLVRVADKEARHLSETTARLFDRAFTPERVESLATNPDVAERVDAFVTRFGRLQDTLGDKLLPVLLTALGERPRAHIDNLDRAERLGLIPSTDQWMEIRRLRNQMIHDYVEDPVVLANALDAARRYAPVLTEAADKMRTEITERGWL